MQMRQAEMEGLLYLELKCATSDCYEINHFSFNSCLCPCGLCHAGTVSLYYLPSNKMLQGTLGVIKKLRGRGTHMSNLILHLLLFLGLGYKATSCQVPLALLKSMTILEFRPDPDRIFNECCCQGM